MEGPFKGGLETLTSHDDGNLKIVLYPLTL